MSRRLIAMAVLLALLAPASLGLPDLLQLLRPEVCYMDCGRDGGPCCCELFSSPPPAAWHRHSEAEGDLVTVTRPAHAGCGEASRAVLPGREWKTLQPRAVPSATLELVPQQAPPRVAPVAVEPVYHSPSRPRAPPVSL